jgi:DNA-directed RNA polymerase specialized sigma24 family protein
LSRIAAETFESLVKLAQAPDANRAQRHAAFGELVVRFQDMAYGYAYAILGDAHLAQDAAQEAFIAAYQKLAQLREPAAFPGWAEAHRFHPM